MVIDNITFTFPITLNKVILTEPNVAYTYTLLQCFTYYDTCIHTPFHSAFLA